MGKALGRRILQAARAKDLSQKELAATVGMTEAVIPPMK